jgi:hypothetical protein
LARRVFDCHKNGATTRRRGSPEGPLDSNLVGTHRPPEEIPFRTYPHRNATRMTSGRQTPGRWTSSATNGRCSSSATWPPARGGSSSFSACSQVSRPSSCGRD